jgi:poly-gamma-glutamate capsule biosynthesis protein CapA/YwtB (metallophosphatase superfamily)
LNSLWSPVRGANAVIANLETPLTYAKTPRINKRYNLKASPEILEFFDSRILLYLANNHVCDYGERGLKDTIDALQSKGIPYAGAGLCLDEARRPAIKVVDGVRLGFVCAADPRHQAVTTTMYGTAPVNPEAAKSQLRALRKESDLVVVSVHGGIEFLSAPSESQMRFADMCLSEGARIVHFHHTHCISGYYSSKSGVVFFGTGNYVFPYTEPRGCSAWNQGAAWEVHIDRSNFSISGIHIRPFHLDHDGLPKAATPSQDAAIRRRVRVWSRRIARRRSLWLWRLAGILHPVLLWLGLVHYADMARRESLRTVIVRIYRAIRIQLGGQSQ